MTRPRNDDMFHMKIFGRHLTYADPRLPLLLVWAYLQMITVTVWMVGCIATVWASHRGWFLWMGIGPVDTGRPMVWYIFVGGLLYHVASTHMGWLERQQHGWRRARRTGAPCAYKKE